ncbi:hypothetical protein LEP1GSC166_1111, partial [Leptospira kirschneri]|uniref:hypothetical protein n=1 Tax=Leptospira kirschneri TaxID=29507 RepID=UPI0002BF7BCD
TQQNAFYESVLGSSYWYFIKIESGLEFHNNLTGAKEPGPATYGKPDSPQFSYALLTLFRVLSKNQRIEFSSNLLILRFENPV